MESIGNRIAKYRKDKKLTQEELAQALFVSRAAISKWESGRGYPNIDSLKGLAQFFSVTIDELLSGGEALTIAEEDHRQRQNRKLQGFPLFRYGMHFLDHRLEAGQGSSLAGG